MEPRHNEGPRDWQNLFTRTRFHYIEVLFHLICCYWGKKKSFVIRRTSLYRGSTVLPCKIHSHLKLSRVMKADWRSFRFCHRIRFFAQRASLLFLTISSLSILPRGARRSGQNVTCDQAILLPFCFGDEGKRNFPQKENAWSQVRLNKEFHCLRSFLSRRTITRLRFVKVMTFLITLKLAGSWRHHCFR